MFNTFSKSLTIAALLSLTAFSAEAGTFEYRVALVKPGSGAGPGSGTGTTPVVTPGDPGGSGTRPPDPATEVVTPPAGAPEVEVSTSALDFGRVATNHAPTTRQVMLMNKGTAPLVMQSGPSLVGSQALGLGLTDCGQPLAPGQACSVEVVYQPTAVTTDTAQLHFITNAAPVTVPVQGEGYNPVSLDIMSFTFLTGEHIKMNFLPLLTVANEAIPDRYLATWELLDPLPPGLQLNSTGLIMGTPDVANIDVFVFRIRATYRGNSYTQQYRVTVGTCEGLGTCPAPGGEGPPVGDEPPVDDEPVSSETPPPPSDA